MGFLDFNWLIHKTMSSAAESKAAPTDLLDKSATKTAVPENQNVVGFNQQLDLHCLQYTYDSKQTASGTRSIAMKS
ncbi:hypothetical protein [Gilliamella sp. wkB171]|uniref:hypothetical protein n=1 Tax=Gilliamella sp. wkB171 TaxID=3120258 RepID=UPI000813BA3C|nr:hypothetical protein [Gilliamella apicola]OCL15685.1 hypothetical protein A9G03_00720 [Gilliamella apicola]